MMLLLDEPPLYKRAWKDAAVSARTLPVCERGTPGGEDVPPPAHLPEEQRAAFEALIADEDARSALLNVALESGKRAHGGRRDD